MKFKQWIHSLIAAVIGGVANSITAMFVAPETFNLQDLSKLGKLAGGSAIISLMFFLKKSPLPESETSAETTRPDDVPIAPRDRIGLVLFAIGLSAMLGLTGCAFDGGAAVRRDTYSTNGTHSVERGRIHPALAWGDARQSLGNRRIANTKTGNSIGVKDVEQETSAANVAPIIGSAGAAFGSAYRAFIGLPPAPDAGSPSTPPVISTPAAPAAEPPKPPKVPAPGPSAFKTLEYIQPEYPSADTAEVKDWQKQWLRGPQQLTLEYRHVPGLAGEVPVITEKTPSK